MLPKIDHRKPGVHQYSKLFLSPLMDDANIRKLKKIQEFLEKENEEPVPYFYRHKKQRSCMSNNNQEHPPQTVPVESHPSSKKTDRSFKDVPQMTTRINCRK